MTKEAIVRGMANWLDKNVVPTLAPRGLLRGAMKGAIAIAKVSPDFAASALSAKFPILDALLPLAGNDEALSAAFAAMKDEAKNSGGFVIQFMEVGFFNNMPHSLVMTKDFIEDLYAEIGKAAAGATQGGAAA